MQRLLLLAIALFSSASAAMLLAPDDAMRQNFGNDAVVTKKNILLSREQAAAISKAAAAPLATAIYRSYTAYRSDKPLGYAVLINGKVRSKSAAVLYIIDISGALKAIEIVAFNEPPEFMPPPLWLKQFEGKDHMAELRVGRDIPTITGATMSARTVTDGARIALAIFESIFMKEQP